MAERISDLSGDEREQRIAELKRKMQEAAKRAQAAHGTEPPKSAPAQATPGSKPAVQPKAAADPVASAQVEVVEAEADNAPSAPSPQPRTAVAPRTDKPSVNGSGPQPGPEAAGPSKSEMNRREFLTYAWGGALGLLALEGLALSFGFMYPRFRAGEFGGKFFIGPESALPDSSAAPQPNAPGKFWLITTEENEPRALYMVCTHLGCLYKWEDSNSRFECPCHGSKFTHDGYYIEGPAPRSLDYFDIAVENDVVVVDTGKKNLGAPASESPAAVTAA